jgi:hypothetical protein
MGQEVAINMNPLTDEEQQFNGDDVANLVQL